MPLTELSGGWAIFPEGSDVQDAVSVCAHDDLFAEYEQAKLYHPEPLLIRRVSLMYVVTREEGKYDDYGMTNVAVYLTQEAADKAVEWLTENRSQGDEVRYSVDVLMVAG
jgi:hypothetical protein